MARASRLEQEMKQEMEQLMVQNRDLEKMNTQLKTSNQVCTMATHSVVYIYSTEQVVILVATTVEM